MGKMIDYFAGPVNVDWKNLKVGHPAEDDMDVHMHVIAGALMNGNVMVVKCVKADCGNGAVLVDKDAGGVMHN